MLLSKLDIGQQATITEIGSEATMTSRLQKLGFEVGALVEILHFGFPANDPISVRIEDHTIALGKQEAESITIKELKDGQSQSHK